MVTSRLSSRLSKSSLTPLTVIVRARFHWEGLKRSVSGETVAMAVSWLVRLTVTGSAGNVASCTV